jgi:UDP-N-acetylmuramate dehydrogenase
MITERKAYSLKKHNTFGIDCKTYRFIEYTTVEDLQSILQQKETQKLPLLSIGSGSNLLFLKDYPGTVLHSRIKGYDIQRTDSEQKEIYVRVGSSVEWDDFVEWCVKHQFYGVENLSAIPGEVGASAVQNIGAYGVEVKDVIDQVEAIEISTGKLRIFSQKECEFAYRKSVFKEALKGQYVVTYVTYRLTLNPHYHLEYGNIQHELNQFDHIDLNTVRQVIIKIREEKLPDPGEEGNAGSFFMNPVISKERFDKLYVKYPTMPHYCLEHGVKIPAAWLIDQCGWKGKTMGAAGVHHKQPLVLVNRGGAKGADIVALATAIQQDVRQKFGIEICPEVNYIG